MSAEQITISGEPFRVERDEDGVWIRHAQWSLIGLGATLEDAYRDLVSEAYDIESSFSSGWNLSPEARRLFDFCKNIDPNATIIIGADQGSGSKE
jgi:hypothetical protein